MPVTWPSPRWSYQRVKPADVKGEGEKKEKHTVGFNVPGESSTSFCMFWIDDLACWSFRGQWRPGRLAVGSWVKGYCRKSGVSFFKSLTTVCFVPKFNQTLVRVVMWFRWVFFFPKHNSLMVLNWTWVTYNLTGHTRACTLTQVQPSHAN